MYTKIWLPKHHRLLGWFYERHLQFTWLLLWFTQSAPVVPPEYSYDSARVLPLLQLSAPVPVVLPNVSMVPQKYSYGSHFAFVVLSVKLQWFPQSIAMVFTECFYNFLLEHFPGSVRGLLWFPCQCFPRSLLVLPWFPCQGYPGFPASAPLHRSPASAPLVPLLVLPWFPLLVLPLFPLLVLPWFPCQCSPGSPCQWFPGSPCYCSPGSG